jgi:hypothetical protein
MVGLAAIRTMPALTNLLVVMLTGEMGLLDGEQREQLKPNLCFLKPFDLEGYRQLAKKSTTRGRWRMAGFHRGRRAS